MGDDLPTQQCLLALQAVVPNDQVFGAEINTLDGNNFAASTDAEGDIGEQQAQLKQQYLFLGVVHCWRLVC